MLAYLHVTQVIAYVPDIENILHVLIKHMQNIQQMETPLYQTVDQVLVKQWQRWCKCVCHTNVMTTKHAIKNYIYMHT